MSISEVIQTEATKEHKTNDQKWLMIMGPPSILEEDHVIFYMNHYAIFVAASSVVVGIFFL